jgi:hypothetical protein
MTIFVCDSKYLMKEISMEVTMIKMVVDKDKTDDRHIFYKFNKNKNKKSNKQKQKLRTLVE